MLAAIGIYGVMAYNMTRRTREIGIRMAVGARRADVLRLVLMEGLRLAVIGSAVGTAAALAVTRVIKRLLFGVAPGDPATFALVVVVMMAVVILACLAPAWRALRVDPMVALRCD